jgi:transcriptional regulator
MYLPEHHHETRIDIQRALIASHPLGLLVTAGTNGLLANPLPFLLDAGASRFGTLRAHMARANPQWRELSETQECLIVFQGAQTYVTPSWYATKRQSGKVVPTWNYIAVHAWGRPKAIHDAEWLKRQICALTAKMERGRAEPWAVTDAPADFIDAQIRGIVGVEIEVQRMEGKWKVSQNRSEADREGVIRGLRGEGNEVMAQLVKDFGRS